MMTFTSWFMMLFRTHTAYSMYIVDLQQYMTEEVSYTCIPVSLTDFFNVFLAGACMAVPLLKDILRKSPLEGIWQQVL